ncbi:hypothetical protein GOBAR_AA26921 [Gossypium barbadense]|uniref:Uncharacterized protein n=1 Tax=Gossypium barbadense TaxID=3634 RepID=A0A2P5WRM5_GOSBA|nr:hypothetical protein GOBAR_AA26921 [Gossypium barbadense]
MSYLASTRSVGKSTDVGRQGAVGSGKDNNNWVVRDGEHIEAWDCRIQSLPVYESFFSADMAVVDDYLTWLRAVDKLYLLPPKARSQKIRLKRQHRQPQQCRRGQGDDDEKEEVYRPASPDAPPVEPPFVQLVVRKNPSCNRRPSPCGTHSP